MQTREEAAAGYAAKLRAEKVTDLTDETIAARLKHCALRPAPEMYQAIRTAYYEQSTEETALACPECGSTESLIELSYRYTWQPVHGLDRATGGNDYSSFDYGDDVIVTGYACRGCDWERSAEPFTPLVQRETREIAASALRIMPTVAEVAQRAELTTDA